ncbi:hypothetical protein V1514DRAFT_108443 [Lipomyces japonicus]|uniref:uncharacterized protein n=1 Tax=Lipomyces japonicus TaxID=56871 RepID=UPI0034CEB041
MDRSSPLAALMPPPQPWLSDDRPPPLNHQGARMRGSSSHASSHGHAHQSSLPNILAINPSDISPSYVASFDSPATLLAVDLSQNFHIARTPVVPTPRRSLLPSFSFGKSNADKTPPPPVSSSPNGDLSMDLSPLPHKSRSRLSQASNSSFSSSTSSIFSGKSSTLSSSVGFCSHKSSDKENVRPISRLKSLSNGSHPHFSASTRGLSITETNEPTLDMLFGESPRHNKPQKSVGFGIDTPKASSNFKPSVNNSDGFASDSPLANIAHRPQKQLFRTKVRRTQSMYQNASDYMAKEVSQNCEILEYAAAAVKSASPLSPPTMSAGRVPLPCFMVEQDDPFKRISPDTLIQILNGAYMNHYDRHVIIDCRFEYEFKGGHIQGAINVNTANQLNKFFLEKPTKEKLLLVFHCEYSAHRAPKMALHLRNRDRQQNMHNYPELHYPDVYILDGGYSSFFSSYRSMCEPQQYVEMQSTLHKDLCEKELGKFRKNMRFARTQSYTFGTSMASHDFTTTFLSSSSMLENKPPDSTDVEMANSGFTPSHGSRR